MTAAVADRLLGVQAGAYRIERLLGKGGMGRVYRASHVTLGFPAAVKVIAEHYAEDAALVERFFAEAQTIAAFQHDNVVRVLDLVRMPDGRPAIVMELVEGESLRTVMDRGAATLGSLLMLVADALTGLAAAHAVGIIHRDLKPENILVSADGRAKVLDFGIAKHMGTALKTQTGIVLGTPQYMAPEQIRGMAPTQSSDLYAMGVILFELVCGRRPFDAPTDFEVMRMHVDLPAPLARTLCPTVHPGLEMVIAGALAKSPAERFASAHALANALREVARQLPPEQQPRPVRMDGVLATTPANARTVPTVNALPDPAVTPTSMPTSARGPKSVQSADGQPRPRSRRALGVAVAVVGIAAVAIALIASRRAGTAPTRTAAAASPPPAMRPDARPAPTPPTPTPATTTTPAVTPPTTRRGPARIGVLIEEATTIAKGISADAVLVGYESTWMVDDLALSLPASEVTVAFVVPSRKPAPDPRLPANAQPPPRCYLSVTITADGLDHGFAPVGTCDVPPASRETLCPLEWVLARAAQKGLDLKLATDLELVATHDAPYWLMRDAKIGDNVIVANDCALLGPGEVVPSRLPPLTMRDGTESFTIPLYVDRTTFDPIVFIPIATRLAQLLDPTAALMTLSAAPLTRSGAVQWSPKDPSLNSRGVRYELAGATWCSIVVMISDDGTSATVFRTGPGRDCLRRQALPTCTRDHLVEKTRGGEQISLYFSDKAWSMSWRDSAGREQRTEVLEPCTRP